MSWGSFGVNSLKIVFVLPLVMISLDTQNIALWLLFNTVFSFQVIADGGFSPTFSRVIAYAMGGSTAEDLSSHQIIRPVNRSASPNWDTIEAIFNSMRRVYLILALLFLFFLSSIGTFSLLKPIAASSDSTSAWIAWVIILLASIVVLRGNVYSAFLQGTGRIALLKRWEMVTALGSIVTSVLVLCAGFGLLGLVAGQQTWMILNIIVNRHLCFHIESGTVKRFKRKTPDPKVYRAVWPSAWRSGLGVLMSYGLIQATGVVYAQIGSSEKVASYLLGLRIINHLSRISQAPFYTKIPAMARFRAAGEIISQISLARRGMTIAYWTFTVGFVCLGVFADSLLKIIESNASFPGPLLWSLLGLAFFCERYGAMHIQLYSTTNHIIWHIANGISGILFITTALLLFPLIQVYAFPIAMLTGNLLFYDWYSALHSYRSFHLKFFQFETRTSLVPLLIMGGYVVSVNLLLDAGMFN